MRAVADEERIRRFLRVLGREAREDVAAYLTGGATAVLHRWRRSTIDIDVVFVPESDALLRAIPRLKDALAINVELASPADFIPVPAGWEARSLFVAREGRLAVYHFDPYSQALAKLERAHAQDLADVEAMLANTLVDRARLRAYFAEIEPQLYRYPAIDPRSFRRRVEDVAASRS